MYAIIQQGGHQYKVQPNDQLDLYRLPGKEGETFVSDKVLLLVEDSKVTVGTPFVVGGSVTFKILKQLKGDKIRVTRFKAKSRYTKIKGFRPFLTSVQVDRIAINNSPVKKTGKKLPVDKIK